MRRRLACLGLLAGCLALRGQPYLDLIERPILAEAERRSMMYSFVDRNLPPIEVPTGREAWETARPRLRREILRLVGLEGLDRRGPVRWVSRGRIDRDGYSIEKILYESYPGMMVPALVYTPRGLTKPVPAMVSIPGHTYCDGKATTVVQARSVNLVRRGVIVLAYDYIGTFERNTGANPCASMPYGGGNDHGHRGFSYTARNPTGLEILDGIRAIDYLLARSDVDPRRVGFTGESGGSNSTYWVAALDDRVSLAVPVASVTTFDYWIRNNRNWDWHQRPPGIRRIAGISTLLALFAPRPMLVIGSLRGTDSDEFPLEETEKSVREARRAYDLYGAGVKIRLWESSTSHGYQQDKRERMYSWVEQHYLGKSGSEPAAELPFLFEPQDALRCGLPSDNKTLADIYKEWLGAIPTPAVDQPERLRRALGEVLGLPDKRPVPVLGIQTTSSRGDTVARQLFVESDLGVRLPAVELSPRQTRAPIPTVLVLGRTADSAAAATALLKNGLRAVFVDLRGTGEIDSGGGRTDNWAWFVGRPWPGMWVEDIQALLTALSGEYGKPPFGILAPSGLGRAALFAAALDPRIGAVFARLPSLSYRWEAERGQLADVPRILSVADLPDAATLMAPRPCWLHFGDTVAEGEIRSTYARTGESYARSGARESFRATAGKAVDWDAVAKWLARQ